MSLWEIVLLSAALAMDACAVGMTNGMTEPNMRAGKQISIAFCYALFQFFMPVVGFYGSSALRGIVEAIAPYLAFCLLAYLGGKMVFDSFRKEAPVFGRRKLTPTKLFLQSVATSIDALAVGVTFLALSTGAGLPMHPVLCCLMIGAITFLLSAVAVEIGKRVGNRLAEKAELFGGVVLLAIGIKILLEAFV